MTQPAAPRMFHLSFSVNDLDTSRAFYGGVLHCQEGRSAPTWVDFDFFGHQLSLHLGEVASASSGKVDKLQVPMPHFGVVLDMEAWSVLGAHLREVGVPFTIEPQIRFEGAPEEQGTLFIADPSGNALEFKGARLPVTLLAPSAQ